MKIIALEEHFVTPEVLEAWRTSDPKWQDLALNASADADRTRRLLEIGPERLAAMDEAGIDVAVLSLTTPGLQSLDRDQAIELAHLTNDRLAAAVRQYPGRLQGFASLPTLAPEAAARELERSVCELGLHGAMVFGRTRDRNFDLPEFWPIFEAAAALKAPLYLHPQSPQRAVLDAYYSGLGDDVDALFGRPGIGWHYEAGVQLLRLVLAGVFDRFPDLQIVTGHWGEVVLFYLERIDLMARAVKLPRKISEYFRQHISVTPSGLFSQRYLRWASEVIGVENILFSTDYPFAQAAPGIARHFLESADLSDTDRLKIASGNWDRLSAGIRR
jgi:predicted TIM-barrel fold metal-dependent hydrolase